MKRGSGLVSSRKKNEMKKKVDVGQRSSNMEGKEEESCVRNKSF